MLLAPLLGGSTQPWSEGVVLFLLGILIFLAPPVSTGSRRLLAILAGLIVAGAIGFLPAAWFGMPEWRLELTGRLGMDLPSTLSPQPWMTLDCLILLVAGVSWISWLQAKSWELEDQRRMVKWFAGGVVLIAAFALAVYFAHVYIPIWLATERMFGPFPNRNQTANFFALGAVLTIALAHESIQEKKIVAAGWFLASLVIGAALVVNYSRAGIVLFFAGVTVWILLLCSFGQSTKRMAVGASLLLALLAAFLFFGGETLNRFQETNSTGLMGFRGLVYKDALTLIGSSPLCGIGLGNFDAVFALFRQASASGSRIIHPESDWLWLWSEAGWPGILLVLLALLLLVKQVFPLVKGTNRRLRAAALAASIAFALHGMVDVSGHRLGSMLPALFVLGLSLPARKIMEPDRWARRFYRIGALFLIGAGLAWGASSLLDWPLPGRIAAAREKTAAKKLMEQQDCAHGIPSITTALEWMPLDWELYYARGRAQVVEGDWDPAFDDFQRARTLETSSAWMPMIEGKLWISRRPKFALVAWREALRRSHADEAMQFYLEMLRLSERNPALLQQVGRLSAGNVRLQAAFAAVAPEVEFGPLVNNLLKTDPDLASLPESEREALFAAWIQKGDVNDLLVRFANNPAWQQSGWREVSGFYAAHNDYYTACQTAFNGIARPVLPKIIADDPTEKLQRRLYLNPADYSAAYALYEARMKQNENKAVLSVLQDVTLVPGCPAYFYFLKADLHARQEEWQECWTALSAYGNALKAARSGDMK